MEQQFFGKICHEFGYDSITDDRNGVQANETFKLQECRCQGSDYYGMPELEFALTANSYFTNLFYNMKPSHYEFFPKVAVDVQESFCNLGLWNLFRKFPQLEYGDGSYGNTLRNNEFALGQNFIRDNGILLNWVTR